MFDSVLIRQFKVHTERYINVFADNLKNYIEFPHQGTEPTASSKDSTSASCNESVTIQNG
jgi:hypothetical protein